MSRLDLEIERARRHERPFAMTRFGREGGPSEADASLTAVVSRIRACDIAIEVDGTIVVVWAETGHAGLERVIRRVTETSGGALVELNSVVFPDAALTRSALLGQLFAEPRSNTPEVALLPAPADRADADVVAGVALDHVQDAAS